MSTTKPLFFFTLLLMISFASVNAVLFTPALPEIANFFQITDANAQLTITWFLIGYALGQLLYGPLAARFGRKPALYVGILIEIISCFICVQAGIWHEFNLLIIGRFFMAIGAGVGLKMTFTIVNEYFEPKEASQKIAYLMLAFAITPGLSVALGGWLAHHFGWESCFYASAIYGVFLLFLVSRLPALNDVIDIDALRLGHLLKAYGAQFTNLRLFTGGLLMGGATTIVYAFAAVAPFVAITIFKMSTPEYGMANLLPPIGLIWGSLTSVQLSKLFPLNRIVLSGIGIVCLGTMLMALAMWLQLSPIVSLFLPVIVLYFGISFVNANASSLALASTTDKAHGSAVLNFINMGTATCAVLFLGLFQLTPMLLPLIYAIASVLLIAAYSASVRKVKPISDSN